MAEPANEPILVSERLDCRPLQPGIDAIAASDVVRPVMSNSPRRAMIQDGSIRVISVCASRCDLGSCGTEG
jgi:hypothetical protein